LIYEYALSLKITTHKFSKYTVLCQYTQTGHLNSDDT